MQTRRTICSKANLYPIYLLISTTLHNSLNIRKVSLMCENNPQREDHSVARISLLFVQIISKKTNLCSFGMSSTIIYQLIYRTEAIRWSQFVTRTTEFNQNYFVFFLHNFHVNSVFLIHFWLIIIFPVLSLHTKRK